MKEVSILIRGGAIAAGKNADFSYIDLLKKNPQWHITDKSNETDNSFDGVWTYEDDIKLYLPKILVIHFGINDAYYPVYRSEFKENLVQLIRLARKEFNPVILLLTSHPFDNIHDMQMVNIYYRTIREVAVDLNTHLLSLHTWFRGYCEEQRIPLKKIVQADTRYPNERGQQLYASAVENKLRSILKTQED